MFTPMPKRHTASLLALSLMILTSCAPPPKKATGVLGPDGGHQIINVAPQSHGAFKTVVENGIEYRQARGGVGKPGGTLYMEQLGDGPKTFNPWASFDNSSSTLGGNMVSGLVDTDAYTGEVVPYLAKDITVQPDKLTYIVKLRKGLTWSDGQPLTTEDVVFTWNDIVAKGLGNPSLRDILMVDGKFPSVRALDPLTLEFKTAKPFAPFMRMLGISIAPKHVFAPIIQKGGEKAFSSAWGISDARKNPAGFVSSGMWLLESYAPGERVVYKRNPHFFMVDPKGTHLPYLDRYVIYFSKDLNNGELQFEQGKIDIYGVPGEYVAHVRKLTRPDFKMYDLGPTTGTTFMVFNLNNRKDPDTGKPKVDPIKSAWFNDVHFRKAVDYAVDRQDMVTNILKGVGEPLYTAESLSSIFLNQDLAKGHPQDMEKAKSLLKEGGFHWNQAGQLIDKAGHRVEFTLYTNTGNTQRESTGVSIKQDLAQLGIQVDFKPMDFNVLVDKMGSGDWESMIMGLTGSALEPHDGTNVWKSTGSVHIFNQRDVRGGKTPKTDDILPWEKELDQIFEAGAQEFDLAKRKEIYNRYQAIVYEQAPFIYLYSPLNIVAAKTRVQNFDPTPLGTTLHNLEEIWVQGE